MIVHSLILGISFAWIFACGGTQKEVFWNASLEDSAPPFDEEGSSSEDSDSSDDTGNETEGGTQTDVEPPPCGLDRSSWWKTDPH